MMSILVVCANGDEVATLAGSSGVEARLRSATTGRLMAHDHWQFSVLAGPPQGHSQSIASPLTDHRRRLRQRHRSN